MRRLCSITIVLLLLISAVVPAWSAPILPDCCLRTAPAAETPKHEHCAGMRMDPEPAPKHHHSGTTISRMQPNCGCVMSRVSNAASPLPEVSDQQSLPQVSIASASSLTGFTTRLNDYSRSERGPPVLLQNQS